MFLYCKFEKLCEEKGITPYRVSEDTGIATATLTNWKNGKYTPKVDKILTIAEYFGKTVDYFLDQ